MGTPKAAPALPYSKKICYDGLDMAGETQLSVQKLTRATMKKGGKEQTKKEQEKSWKEQVYQRLKDHNRNEEVKYLDDNNWLGNQKGPDGNLVNPDGQALDGKDAFSNLWQKGSPSFQKANPGASSDSVYHGYVWGHSAHHPSDDYLAGVLGKHSSKKKNGENNSDLMHDSAMQPITAVQRKYPDGSIRSSDPLKNNYAVAKQTGRLIKVTYANGEEHFMPADEQNSHSDLSGDKGADVSNAGEMSQHASTYGSGNVNMEPVGKLSSKGVGDYMTNEEWDEIGKGGYKNPDGTIPNTRSQLDEARKAKGVKPPAKPAEKQASADTGGPKLLYGYWNVMHGADFRCVGYADSLSVHQQGGWMEYGSNTAFVGQGCFPLSRQGDGTSDGLAATTGAEDFMVGGSPTKVGSPL